MFLVSYTLSLNLRSERTFQDLEFLFSSLKHDSLAISLCSEFSYGKKKCICYFESSSKYTVSMKVQTLILKGESEMSGFGDLWKTIAEWLCLIGQEEMGMSCGKSHIHRKLIINFFQG